MKKIILFILSLFIQSLSQSNPEVIHYTQNSTGFLHGFQDFDVDNNGRIIQVASYYNAVDCGGVTVFDGTHWKFTKKGENGFAFAAAYKVFYSENGGTYYVYGAKLNNDIEGQKYFIQKFNAATNSWELIGDSVSFNYAAGLIDFLVTENGDIYATGTGGFMKLYPGSAERIYPEDNPWFYPDYILPKSDGAMYLIDNWTDGWGNSHTSLWNYTGTALDTVKSVMDSVLAPTSVSLDNYGNVWFLESSYILSHNKLVKYVNGREKTYTIPLEGNAFALTMTGDGDNLWFGTYNDQNILLVKFNVVSESWEIFDLGKIPCFPYNNDIRKIVVKGGYLYLSNQNYIIKYDKNQNQIVATWSQYNTGLPGPGSGNDVIKIHIDKDGHYWANSLNYGVAMFNGDKWRTYGSCEINNSLIVTSWAITTDISGRVFTVGDSLRYMENGEWHSVYPSSTEAQLFYGVSIAADDDNSVWFADFYNGLGKYNLNYGNFTFYNSGIPSTKATELMIAGDGRIWLGYGDNTCSCASVFDGTSFINYSDGDGLTLKNATGICETPNGEIWYAFKEGLAKFANGTWTSYTIQDYNIPLTEIKAIASDNDGTIWFGGFSSDVLKIFSFDGNEITEHVISENVSNAVWDLAFDENGNIWIAGGDVFVYNPDGNVIIDVEENNPLKTKNFTLYQNYPNPFNPTTTIKYTIQSVIARSSDLSDGRSNLSNSTQNRQIATNLTTSNSRNDANVLLVVYDILGREISTLVNQRQAPGNYSVQFDASNLPSGVYFYTLRVGDFTATKKMLLLK